MEYLLVLVLLQNYPTSVETIYIEQPNMTACFEAREVFVDRFKLQGGQAVCIELKG